MLILKNWSSMHVLNLPKGVVMVLHEKQKMSYCASRKMFFKEFKYTQNKKEINLLPIYNCLKISV